MWQVHLRAPFSSARLAPRPDGPLTHFASPRGETCRLSGDLPAGNHFPQPFQGRHELALLIQLVANIHEIATQPRDLTSKPRNLAAQPRDFTSLTR